MHGLAWISIRFREFIGWLARARLQLAESGATTMPGVYAAAVNGMPQTPPRMQQIRRTWKVCALKNALESRLRAFAARVIPQPSMPTVPNAPVSWSLHVYEILDDDIMQPCHSNAGEKRKFRLETWPEGGCTCCSTTDQKGSTAAPPLRPSMRSLLQDSIQAFQGVRLEIGEEATSRSDLIAHHP